MRVLLVEDDVRVAAALSAALQRRKYTVTCSTSAREALTFTDMDLVLLDMGLPDGDGVTVCRQLRRRDPEVPIIAVTARGAEHDRVAGLQAGADDYVVKPFSMAELQARIEAVLRRTVHRARAADTVLVGGLRLDATARSATDDGRDLMLTRKEFDLLLTMARRPDTPVSRNELLLAVWHTTVGGDHTLEVHIAALRRKIGAPGRIRTVRGVGYALSSSGPLPQEILKKHPGQSSSI
ncbi:response regulator transcription factor [Actinoplanes sp. NPDC020271]|uniref:response regulator transcription factor n=1 Tax=Actinoplanes sp. NPDC020271 TaxID=3363896 RepID=UPI003797AD13